MTALLDKPQNTDKRAFSIAEFSQRWGWGNNTTYNLINAGKLKSVKVGRRRIITVQQEAEFSAALEGRA
jgi:excisionase family DNA binding protein